MNTIFDLILPVFGILMLFLVPVALIAGALASLFVARSRQIGDNQQGKRRK